MPREGAGRDEDVTSSEQAAASDVLLSYLARQHMLELTAHVVDQEASQRLALQQQYHKQFARIAESCIERLEQISRQYGAIHDSVRLSLGQHLARRESALCGSPAASTTSPERNNGRTTLAGPPSSPQQGITTPRIVLSTREYSPKSSCLVQSTVKLTGAPQLRRKNAVEKKLAQELSERRKCLEEFAAQEQRRSAAVSRRDAAVLHRALQTGEHNLDAFVDSTKMIAREYKESGPLRREMDRKLDAMEEQQRRRQLEQQAAAYALKKIDHVVQEEVQETVAQFEAECSRLHEVAVQIHWENQRRVEASQRSMKKTLNSKRGSVEEYQKAYRSALKDSLQTAVRREHDKRLHSVKIVTHAVNVEFPPNASPSKAFEASFASSSGPRSTLPTASSRSMISTAKYAQFCGARESIAQGIVDLHRDPMILSTIVGVPPAAWK